MQNQVVADIEIEDQKIAYYSAVVIRQSFNAHHEFAIRIKYDVLEKIGSFSLSNAQKLIGKSAVIKLKQADSLDVAYEFRGLICEINMEQSDNFTSDFVLKGYSPTILMETGPNLTSFYKKNLKQIVQKLTQPASQNCSVKINPTHSATLNYISQYRESTFNFLNRLSSDFSEWFYYDGKDLFFGRPSSSPNIDITYGEDVHSMQIKLQLLPLAFSSYAYLAKNDSFISSDAPSSVSGLDQYANHALQESNKIFAEPVSFPIKQRVESKGDLDDFVKKQKAAMAADLEILSGSGDNPALCIGAIANLKISALDNITVNKDDGGKFLITAIEHHITENGKYYNNFEGIPSGMEIIPVKNIQPANAEPQIATVKDNKDPDNMGRVRVQMLWQQPLNEMTDWVRVMTPDAGGGKGGAKNRGLVVIPEPGDQVVVCFRYNDPNRPFVMGSMFHGKTGGGGGQGNKTKSLTALSSSTVSLEGDAINIVDAKGNKISLDGAGKININCTSSITLECGSSKMSMDSGGKIDINGKQITINGTEITISGSSNATMKSTASFKAEGTTATVQGTSTEVKGDAKVEVSAPSTTVKGEANLKLQSNGTADLEGTAMTNVKGGVVNLN